MDAIPVPRPFKAIVLEGGASTHQGDPKFGRFAGSQCLSNCVVYLLYSYLNNQQPVIQTHALDRILQLGTRVDKILRQSGSLIHAHAQLSNIPSCIQTPEISSFIYKSAEIYGIIGRKAAISLPSVMSLRQVLTKNYSGIPQFLVIICNSKSLAIIIYPTVTFLFNPHCFETVCNSPAHVISSTHVEDILNYVADEKDVYTACYLYFVPTSHPLNQIQDFLFKTYMVDAVQPLYGLAIDLSSDTGPTLQPVADKDLNAKACTSRAKPHVNTPRNENNPVSFNTNIPADIVHTSLSEPTGNLEDHTITTLPINVADIPIPPSPTDDQPETVMQPTAKFTFKVSNPAAAAEFAAHASSILNESLSTEHAVNTSPTEDTSVSGEKRKRALSDASDRPPHISYDKTVHEPIVASNVPPPNEIADESSLSQDTTSDPFDLTSIKSLLDDLHTLKHMDGFPIMVDHNIMLKPRESEAVHVLGAIINNIIVEHGLVTTCQESSVHSAMKNLLRFTAVWAQKLSVPLDDFTVLLDTDLKVQNLTEAINSGKFHSTDLKDHLSSKLTTTLQFLHTNNSEKLKKLQGDIRSASDALNAEENVISPEKAFERLKVIIEKHALVISAEDLKTITASARAFLQHVTVRNIELRGEDQYFSSILDAIDTFQPVQQPVVAIDSRMAERSDQLVEHTNLAVQNIEFELTVAIKDFISAASPSTSTSLPDFTTLLWKCETTVRTLKFCAESLKLPITSDNRAEQQLMYIGGELSGLVGGQWPFASVPPVYQLEPITSLHTWLKQAKRHSETTQKIQQILDEVEAAIKSHSVDYINLEMIQSYLASAATLLGDTPNARFDTLKKQLTEMLSSEEAFIAVIDATTFYSVVNMLPKITNRSSQHPHLLKTLHVTEAFNRSGAKMVREVINAISLRNPTITNSTVLAAMRAFMAHTTMSGHQDFGTAVDILASIQQTIKVGTDGARWRACLDNIAAAETVINRSSMPGDVKKLLFAQTTRLEKECRAQATTYEASLYKARIDQTTTITPEELNKLLEEAPNDKLKLYAKSALKNKVSTPHIAANSSEQARTEATLNEAVAQRGVAAWNKIKESFKNMHFKTLTFDDWAALSAEYGRSSSTLSSTIAAELTKLTEDINTKLDNLLKEKLTSLLPQGPQFTLPLLDWIDSYEKGANFYLQQFSLPLISQTADNFIKKKTALLQAVSSSDLIEATVGTPLEEAVRTFTDVYAALEASKTNYHIQIESEVSAYVKHLEKLAGTGTPDASRSTSRPNLHVPKSLFTSAQLATVMALPSMLQNCLLKNEQSLLQEIKQDIQVLENSITVSETQWKVSMAELNQRLQTAITQLLPLAPVIISSRPVQPTDPLRFLEDAATDKHINNTELYATTQVALQWLTQACSHVAVLCPPAMQPRLETLAALIHNNLVNNKHYLEMEESANSNISDLEPLETAISALNAQRVRGGKATVDTWKAKLMELKQLLDIAEKTSQVIQDVNSLVSEAQNTLQISRLQLLLHKVETIQAAGKQVKLETTHPDIWNTILETITYLKFKIALIVHYSTPTILNLYPLSDIVQLPTFTPQTYDAQARLKILCAIKPVCANWTWVETNPKTDPIRPALLPAIPEAPLSLHPHVYNFLELHAFAGSRTTRATIVSTISSVTMQRQGLLIAETIKASWPDLIKHAPAVLDAYKQMLLSTHIQDNTFLSILLFSHMCYLATQEYTVSPHARILPLTHLQWLQMIVTFWPPLARSILHAPSFQAAAETLRAMFPHMMKHAANYALEANYTSTAVFPPNGRILHINAWESTSVEDLLWTSKPFLSICNNHPLRARIAFLTWGLSTIDATVIEQLWSSLKPETRGLTTPHSLLMKLINTAFGPLPGTISVNHAQTTPPIPYVYGEPTGRTLTTGTSSTPVKEEPLPTTAFEVALGALLVEAKIVIYCTTGTAWVPSFEGEALFLVSTLLDCTGTLEPFKTLLATPKISATACLSDIINICIPEEMQMFVRQATWLNDNLLKLLPPQQETFNVFVDSNNLVTQTLIRPHLDASDEPLEIVLDTNHQKWPASHIINTPKPGFTLTADDLPDFYRTLTYQYEPATLQNTFTQFPSKLMSPPQNIKNARSPSANFHPSRELSPATHAQDAGQSGPFQISNNMKFASPTNLEYTIEPPKFLRRQLFPDSPRAPSDFAQISHANTTPLKLKTSPTNNQNQTWQSPHKQSNISPRKPFQITSSTPKPKFKVRDPKATYSTIQLSLPTDDSSSECISCCSLDSTCFWKPPNTPTQHQNNTDSPNITLPAAAHTSPKHTLETTPYYKLTYVTPPPSEYEITYSPKTFKDKTKFESVQSQASSPTLESRYPSLASQASPDTSPIPSTSSSYRSRQSNHSHVFAHATTSPSFTKPPASLQSTSLPDLSHSTDSTLSRFSSHSRSEMEWDVESIPNSSTASKHFRCTPEKACSLPSSAASSPQNLDSSIPLPESIPLSTSEPADSLPDSPSVSSTQSPSLTPVPYPSSPTGTFSNSSADVHSVAPSITHSFIQLSDILANTTSSSDRLASPIITAIHSTPEPTILQYTHNISIHKTQLLEIIETLRLKIVRSSHKLLKKINRIKMLYL